MDGAPSEPIFDHCAMWRTETRMQSSGLRLLVSSGMRQRHTNASPSLRRVMPTTHLRRHNSARFGEEKRSAHCVNQNQVSWRKIASSPLRSGNIVLSKQQAISAVEARLVSLEPPANGDSWIVIPEYVEERASCFVVFWGSRVFHETRGYDLLSQVMRHTLLIVSVGCFLKPEPRQQSKSTLRSSSLLATSSPDRRIQVS